MTEKMELLLNEFNETIPSTINNAIERIKSRDDACGQFRSWRFYVHLNKLPAQMRKKGLIGVVGRTTEPGKKEKLWVRN